MRDSRRGAEITVQSLPDVLARVDTSCEMVQQKTRSISCPCWISSLSRTSTSGRAGHTVIDTGRKKVANNSTRQNNFKRGCRKKQYENIHDRFIRDTWFRKTMIELGRVASEGHNQIAIEEKLMFIVTIGGSAQILWIPTQCR